MRDDSVSTPSGYSSRPAAEVTLDAPAWFRRAADRVHSTHEVDVAGCPVRYLSWGGGPGPTTLLVHGGAAHAQWWAPVAALVAESLPGRVVAMDLSGHGLSGRRPSYGVDLWADEIEAVAADSSQDRVVVVGHSLGGIVAAYASVRTSGRMARFVAVDSPVWDTAPPPEIELSYVAGRPARTYQDVEEALARFRLVPPQECDNPWYLRHVAWHGLRPGPHGWEWRFDPQIFADPTGDHRIARFEGDLADSGCPVDVVMGGLSYLVDGARAAFHPSGARRPGVTLSIIPGARHHVMLDQPVALADRLVELLSHPA